MTEIFSKGDAKFTSEIKGLTNNSHSEGDLGMFDALFGMISEEEIEIDTEIAAPPDNLTLPTTENEQKAQNPALLASMLSNVEHVEGSDKNKLHEHITNKSNWVIQDSPTGTFKLTLELKDTEKNSNFLDKLAAVLKEGSKIEPEQNKILVLEQKNTKSIKTSLTNSPINKDPQPHNNEVTEKDNRVITDYLTKGAYQIKNSLLENGKPIPMKEKQVMLNVGTEQITENASQKGIQLPKLLQSSPGKEISKADLGQNASVATSNSNTSMSNNNTNSGGNLGSGNSSHASGTMVLEHLNMLDKSWGKNLLNRVQTALQNGETTIELALKPKNLGKLKVSLSLQNEGARINIVTETPSAALLLAESEGKLSQMLEGSGLKLSNLNTSTEQEKKGTPDQNSNEKNKDQNQLGKKEVDLGEQDLELGTTNSHNQSINLIA